MCYAKPGPRCASHLAAAMETVRAQVEENRVAVNRGEPEPYPGVTGSTLLRLQDEYDGTLTGQREIQADIDAEKDPHVRATLEARKDAAAARYAEKMAALEAVEGQWGVVTVAEGSRTPWGEAQTVSRPAAGIAAVSTAGHGGIKLSPQRNAVIPPGLRNRSGWYEEDAEAAVVGMYHPEAFPHYQDGDYDKIRAACEASVKNWDPDGFEKATGQTVDVSESTVLRERAKAADKAALRAFYADQYVTLGNGSTSNQQPWIPHGYAVTTARIDNTGEERDFLVPKDEVIEDGMWGKQIVIDPNRALDVTTVTQIGKAQPSATREPIRGDALVVDYSSLNSRAADTAANELNHRYRWNDGTVSTFGDRLAQEGVTGKQQTSSGYHVQMPDGSSYTIKKATFDALTTVPDTTTDVTRARIAQHRAAQAMDRIPSFERDKKARAEARYLAAVEKTNTLEAQDKAENPLNYYDGIQAARTEAFNALAAEKGLSFGD